MSQTFANLQKMLPQHLLSRAIGKFAASESPFISRLFISQFARAYGVSLHEAEEQSLQSYGSFNAFFTRSLQPGVRPMPASPNAVASPADGVVSQVGKIDHDQLLQAKGHRYALHSLAGAASSGLLDGDFITIYLAPSDYHRVHLPFAGTLQQTIAIPGALFSVNGSTERAIGGLFCRNERLVCRFSTDLGPMLVVLVGAMIVASIETVWNGPASPYRAEQTTSYDLSLARGDEIGRFLLGSTVICCFPPGAVKLDSELQPGSTIRVGQTLGNIEG